MLSRIPLVGRLFAEDGESIQTLDDARRVVETFAATLDEKEAEVDALTAAREAVDASLRLKAEAKAALEAAKRVFEGAVDWAVLRRGDDQTTNAIIDRFGRDDDFDAKARAETEALLKRDAEDDEKLAKGIALSVANGVLERDVAVELVRKIDVRGRSADDVASFIYDACPKDGAVVVLQGLSGCGKGTTVAKLLKKFDSAVAWSNGNVFRSLTLLALAHCEESGLEFSPAVLTPDNLGAWLAMLRFDHFAEGYDIAISGLGVEARVSKIANTTLKQPAIGKNIPTVASVSQGEVVKFANACLQRMSKDGLTVLVEGRAPTLAYVRSPYRFELTIDDPLLLGQRRVAQRFMAAALAKLDALDGAEDPTPETVDDALNAALATL